MTATDVSGLRRDRAAVEIAPPRRRFGTRVVLPLGLAAAFIGVVLFAARDALLPSTDVEVVQVVVRDQPGGPVAAAGAVVAQAAGWVEPDPFPIYVAALADGVVRDVLVLEGDHVKEGQAVARLVPDDAEIALRRADAKLAEMAAAVGVANAERDAAQRDWDNPVARERAVRETEAEVAGVVSDQAELASKIAGNAAEVARLRDDLQRAEREHAGGATGGFDVSQTRLKLATAEATLAASEARKSVLVAELDGARARRDAAKRDFELRIEEKRRLEAAKAAVERATAQREGLAAARDEAKLRLDRMVIRAPQDGAVMIRLVAPGAKVMMAMDSMHSAHVIHLYDPAKLQVRVDVPLADAAGVGVGQRAEVIVEVLPDQVFQGAVTRIVREADVQKNTIQVKVAIEDPTDDLKPEMLARVRFLGSVASTGGSATPSRGVSVYVPAALLFDRVGDSAAVFVVDEGNSTAERRVVTVSSALRDGWAQVLTGLAPGDAVIDARNVTLDDGDRVHVTGESGVTQWL